MRQRPFALALPFAALLLAAAVRFGPPRLEIREVRDTPPVPGAVLLVAGHHHTDEPEADVSARAITMRGGTRESRPITLTRYGATGHYAVTKQWAAGTPWLLVFTIKQGKHEAYNTAEVFVKVNASGGVDAIEPLMERNARGDRYPRAATEAEIAEALRGR